MLLSEINDQIKNDLDKHGYMDLLCATKGLDIEQNVVITVADLNAIVEEMFLRAAEEEKEGAREIEGLIERVGGGNWLNALEAGLTFILTDERNM